MCIVVSSEKLFVLLRNNKLAKVLALDYILNGMRSSLKRRVKTKANIFFNAVHTLHSIGDIE